MSNGIRVVVLGFCTFGLVSCASMDDRVSTDYPAYAYTYNDSRMYYPQNYYNMSEYTYSPKATKSVEVPESYHVGAYHSPVSFKDRDRDWVKNQSPQKYTIELGDGEKASEVANKLYKTPKNDRMGQVEYKKAGKSYYKGLYGSYENAEAAQKALDALPADVKQGAEVKNWGNVQGAVQ